MKVFALLCLLVVPVAAVAGPPETQEEKDALGAFVIGQMLDVQVSICAQGVPQRRQQLTGLLADWRSKKADLLLRGETSFRKHAPEIAPTMSADEYLAKLRQAEKNRYFGMNPDALSAGCQGLVSWFAKQPKSENEARAADSEYVSGHGTFAFSPQIFSGRFLVDSHPMKIETQPRDVGDHVRFTSSGGPFLFIFEVVSWPTGPDTSSELAKVEAKAKTSPNVQSTQIESPCAHTPLVASCLSIQDIEYKGKLPIYARGSVIFQANGWTYSVSAANFGPSMIVQSEADLRGFHPEGSLANSEMALKSFLGALRLLPATVPAVVAAKP